MTGPYTCGYYEVEGRPTIDDDEICGRWNQLATFYPLSWQRECEKGGQYMMMEPYGNMARNATYDRLKYTKFLYTAMFNANQTGSTFFDPLFYAYPSCEGSYLFTEETFMVGDIVKVSPVMNTTNNFTNQEFISFFPPGNWTDLDDLTVLEVTIPMGKPVTL